MVVEKLKLRHFRNYGLAELEPVPGKNVLSGDNGQGKTNILEALYLCGTGSSYRTSRDADLISWGESAFYAACRFLRRSEPLLVEVRCSREAGKTVKLNGIPQDASVEGIGAANVVVFGPDDLRMIKGGPVERRRFLDTEIGAVSDAYRRNLSAYRRILAQRNALLKQARYESLPPSRRDCALEAWDEQLAAAGARLMLKRAEAVRKLSLLAKVAHRHISPNGAFEMVYRPSFNPGIASTAATRGDDAEALRKLEESFRRELERARPEELMRSVTLVGPHRDEVSFLVDGVDMRVFGSQGQQRSVLLSVRLGELEFVKSEVGEEAILLLDDVSSELDPGKRARLWEYLDDRVQTIITTTDERLLGDTGGPAKRFRVDAGRVEEVN
ncbi:MAG: DNA replication/repair protein RecF [Firmicutes bacterium]|jgi:DNA replication and repair protein RecF|nr:DNA replication/repair protein RecF [Bacillota bacterium]MDH7495868.1 DNA replication/repair protein RecF [Bacillota bacterium]